MSSTLSNPQEINLTLPHDLRNYVRALSSITRLLEEKTTDDHYLGSTELRIWEIYSAFADSYIDQVGGAN